MARTVSMPTICARCGQAYSTENLHFLACYAHLYKGTGRLPYCKPCVEGMYDIYLSECNDVREAVRQMCRKLDLFWADKVFDLAMSKSTARTIMTQYIGVINRKTYAGLSYDDTLKVEGAMWQWGVVPEMEGEPVEEDSRDTKEPEEELEDVPKETKRYWGPNYTNAEYHELEYLKEKWTSDFGSEHEIDVGTKGLIKQICILEMIIARDGAEGKDISKNVNALNNIIGSANLRPSQRASATSEKDERTPFGVWIRRWENERPVPEADKELRDVDGIVKYISTWFLGHLAKMLNIKNAYSKLYEDEIDNMRFLHPELDDEDDESFFNSIFSNVDDPTDDTLDDEYEDEFEKILSESLEEDGGD